MEFQHPGSALNNQYLPSPGQQGYPSNQRGDSNEPEEDEEAACSSAPCHHTLQGISASTSALTFPCSMSFRHLCKNKELDTFQSFLRVL